MNYSPCLEFQFPLNVYSCILLLEEGRVDYLHFALFDRPDEAVTAAQQRSTDLVLARLPEPPAAILEVGIGTGTTLKTLVEAGHHVTGISPEAAQVRLAEQRLAEGAADISGRSTAPGGDGASLGKARLECVGFEGFRGEPGVFDLVLLQESFQYVDARDLFTRAHQLLAPGGRILLLDEFLGKPSHYDIHLPNLDATRALARECGFSLVEEVDLTAAAAPTVDYLLDRIETRRARLLAELPLSGQQLDDLLAALRQYKSAYADGSCRYALLSLERKAPE